MDNARMTAMLSGKKADKYCYSDFRISWQRLSVTKNVEEFRDRGFSIGQLLLKTIRLREAFIYPNGAVS